MPPDVKRVCDHARPGQQRHPDHPGCAQDPGIAQEIELLVGKPECGPHLPRINARERDDRGGGSDDGERDRSPERARIGAVIEAGQPAAQGGYRDPERGGRPRVEQDSEKWRSAERSAARA